MKKKKKMGIKKKQEKGSWKWSGLDFGRCAGQQTYTKHKTGQKEPEINKKAHEIGFAQLQHMTRK